MARVDKLIAAADASGFTVDYLEWLSRGLEAKAEAILFGNISTLPQNMKSSGNPYISRSLKAPFSEIR